MRALTTLPWAGWVSIVLAGIAALDLTGRPPSDGFVGTPALIRARGDIPVRVAEMSFGALEGWQRHDLRGALAPLSRSCRDFVAGPAQSARRGAALPERLGVEWGWRDACSAIDGLVARNPTPAHVRFTVEFHFAPIMVAPAAGAPGRRPAKVTGYFEPLYQARRAPEGRFTAPVLGKPDDLVTVDLGAFREDLGGRRIAGRLRGDRLVPYDTHQRIIADPPPSSPVYAWLDPNDLLFLQIQGSGRLRFPDGEQMRIGYAAQNGHPYTAIGRTLVRDGELALADVTMQSIRNWLDAAPPERAAAVRHSNASYVFFWPLDALPDPALGPLGAAGLQLTPRRSLAIDPRYYPYGLPIWVEAQAGEDLSNRLYIAQDTGGAIKGPQRADLYIGAGDIAGDRAGRLNAEGRLIALVPRRIVRALSDDAA